MTGDEVRRRFRSALAVPRFEQGVRTLPVHDADYWRDLNPQLTISADPFGGHRTRHRFHPLEVDALTRQLRDEGYLQASPVINEAVMDGMRTGILRVVQAGLPSVFACVYDEFYRLFDGLDELFEPTLGARYLMVPHGFWSFHVAVGDTAHRDGFSAAPPHRDLIGIDHSVSQGGAPTIVNVWIPLTDATPLNSCMYVLPGNLDPHYRTPEHGKRGSDVRLQDIRALPAVAGSVLAWTVHLLHWGSRSAPNAPGPRMSVATYFQRRDVVPFHGSALEIPSAIPFESRLEWIARSLDSW